MTKRIKVGVVMDPIAGISYKKDSTLAMLWAAKDRGWELFYLEQPDIYLDNGRVHGLMSPLDVFHDPDNFYRLGEQTARPLADLDVILMRKDPPVDQEFLDATHLLGFAEREGVLVVNPTKALRECNEKLYAQCFPQCLPPSIVTTNPTVIRDFHTTHGDIILKPLDGMGGTGIFRVKEEGLNLGSVIEQLTLRGQRQIMVQRYLPEISAGDTRILLIEGEPVAYGLARIPGEGEVRGNLAAGGRGVARELTERDLWLVDQVKASIKEQSLIFVGLDVIGDYITEINVTSPTCIREIDDQKGTHIAGQLMDAIEQRLS